MTFSSASNKATDLNPRKNDNDQPEVNLNNNKQLDIKSVMKSIRKNISENLKSTDSEIPIHTNSLINSDSSVYEAGDLRDSEDRKYLNLNYAKHSLGNFAPVTHRKGLLGKLIVKFKTRLSKIVDDILQSERDTQTEFNLHSVRFLNTVSEYVDSRDSKIFWELIKKIDVDINNSMRRIESISLEQDAERHKLERKLTGELAAEKVKFETIVNEFSDKINTLESVTLGIERLISKVQSNASENTEKSNDSLIGITTTELQNYPDTTYIRLENRFRGSEEDISKRIADYVPLFGGLDGEVLDVGCGRGELLSRFKEQGISSRGIDIDPAMVKHCQDLGLPVTHEDVLNHLDTLADKSLGGLIAVEVVEHLSLEQLQKFLTLCNDKIKAGGVLVLETVNPKSLVALSSNYFRDPTHKFPLHPDTLGYMVNNSGFEVQDVQLRSPLPYSAKLKPFTNTEFMSPKWVAMCEHLNSQIKTLNDLIYGHQEYAVIARNT